MRWKNGTLVSVPDGEVDITDHDVQFPIADLPIIYWALDRAAEADRADVQDIASLLLGEIGNETGERPEVRIGHQLAHGESLLQANPVEVVVTAADGLAWMLDSSVLDRTGPKRWHL